MSWTTEAEAIAKALKECGASLEQMDKALADAMEVLLLSDCLDKLLNSLRASSFRIELLDDWREQERLRYAAFKRQTACNKRGHTILNINRRGRNIRHTKYDCASSWHSSRRRGDG